MPVPAWSSAATWPRWRKASGRRRPQSTMAAPLAFSTLWSRFRTGSRVTDILRRIEAYKRDEIAAAKVRLPLVELSARAQDVAPPRGFLAALQAKRSEGKFALIAEIK